MDLRQELLLHLLQDIGGHVDDLILDFLELRMALISHNIQHLLRLCLPLLQGHKPVSHFAVLSLQLPLERFLNLLLKQVLADALVELFILLAGRVG